MVDYSELQTELSSLIEGVPHVTANLANASALIWYSVPVLNWAGFYLIEGDNEEKKLVLGPFQGRPACIEIPLSHGVCGTAAAEDRTIVVANVHDFPGHIACDSASASEIVVPLHRPEGTVFGVLDIDSPVTGRFREEDREGMELLAKVIEKEIGSKV